MAINIPDGFNVGAGVPIDARFKFATLVDRDALAPVVRYEGLECYVEETSLKYYLKGGIDNADWAESGGSADGVTTDGLAEVDDIPVFNSEYEIVRSGLKSRIDGLVPGYVSVESSVPATPLMLHGGGVEPTAISENGIQNFGTDIAPMRLLTISGVTATLLLGKNFYTTSDAFTTISYLAFTAGVLPDEVEDGREVSILNASTTDKTIVNEAPTDPSGSSIVTGAGSDVTLAPGQTFTFKYSTALGAWGLVGSAASGGGQSLETAFQLYAKEDLSEWAGTVVIDGSFVKETVDPINGKESYKFTRGASATSAFLVSPPQPIAKRFRGQTCTLYFPVSYTGIDGIATAQLYDNTNAALIPGVIPLNGTNGGIVVAKTNVTIPLTCESVDFIIRLDGADAGAVLQFDDIQLTSDTTVYGLVDRGNVGEILAFAGSTAPTGFIACNGAAVSRSQYNELFKVIGITHGQGDGSTTFNLPDYRGRFLRGVANGSTNDPDRASRTAMATGGNTGDNVGSVQTDELKSHTHNIGAGVDDGASSFVDRATNLQVNIPTAATGGSETRPINAYVNYYIRYSETSTNILTAPDTFSTDTAPLVYAPSSTYTLATLENAPVGTFITYTYAANGNVRTQTTTAPTQTTASMNANGIQIFTRAYSAASTAAQPAVIAIQVGKGMKGKSLDLYKNVGKTTSGELDAIFASLLESGAVIKSYDESTGVLVVDAGINYSSTTTGKSFYFSDVSTQNNGFLVANLSKNPALTGLGIDGINQIAYVYDQKANGTDGGTSVANTWTNRTLNTLVDPSGVVSSLASNVITLRKGTYIIDASSSFHTAGSTNRRTRIRIFSTVNLISGIMGNSAAGADTGVYATAELSGRITLTQDTTITLQYYCAAAGLASTGLGIATSAGIPEIYSMVKIQKIG